MEDFHCWLSAISDAKNLLPKNKHGTDSDNSSEKSLGVEKISDSLASVDDVTIWR